MIKEQWKPVKGYENYSVSNLGEVKNNSTGRILKSSNGRYEHLVLPKEGGYKSLYVHRLVAIAFVNPNGKKEVNHIDGNKKNNKADNLEWCTSRENINHAWGEGLMTRNMFAEYKKNATSKFLGVCWNKNNDKWSAQITIKGKRYYLGDYSIESDAALAYSAIWAII